jgi:two-component system, NarL family, sensor kinase
MGRIGIIRFAMLVLYGIALKPCFAQFEALRPEHQSLLKSLDKTRRSVDSLIEWAYDVRFSAQEQAYANAAFVQANRIGYPAGAATALVKLGHIALDAAVYTEADRCYHQALHLRDSLKLVSGVASCYNNLSLVKKKQGDYPTAINLLKQGLEVAQDTHRIAIALHNNLGILLSAMSRCEEAFQQFEQSLTLAESFREKADMASARLNMGSLLQDCQGQYDQALTLLEQCRNDLQALKRPDLLAKCYLLLGNNAYFKGIMPLALEAYEKAAVLRAYLDRDERAVLQKNRGRVFLDEQRFDKAYIDFTAALDSLQRYGNQREIAATHFELGNYHYERTAFEAAVEQYRKALSLNPDDLMLKSQLLFFLPDALDQIGRETEANTYRTEYKQFMERLDSTQSSSAWQRLMLHRVGKQVTLSRLEREERRAERGRFYGIMGLLAALLTIAVLGVYASRQKRRLAEREAELAREREKLAEQEAETAREKATRAIELARQQEQKAIQEKLDLLKNRELENNYARLEGQDDMQKKIGGELHENVCTMLSLIKMNLASVDDTVLPQPQQQTYTKTQKLLDDVTQDVRRISHELSGAVLTKFGLQVQLEALRDALQGTGKYDVELNVHGLSDRLDYKTELNTYRIVQELVHNVIKHAGARNISIQVNRFGEEFSIMVEDDGKGFDATEALQKAGAGMQNLSARVHDLGGTFRIDSRHGRGTMVSIEAPVG